MKSHARPPTSLMIWNIVSLNVGWFACVLSAANGLPWLGPCAVAVLLAIHLYLVPGRRREIVQIVAAGLFGYALDSVLVLTGVFAFPSQTHLGAPSTIWMVALWCNFATAFSVALYWLAKRPLTAALLGAAGGPMAYFGGLKFGALLAPSGTTTLLAMVSLEWAIATPLVMAGAVWIGRLTRQPAPVEAQSWA